MKIALVVPGFSADEADWCIPAHTDTARALAERHTVHVFAMRYPHRADTYAVGGATVHSFNGVGSRGLGSARLWRGVMNAIADEHRRAPFDVLHSIFGSESGCLTVLAAKRLRVPSVVWLVNGELTGLREIGYGADLVLRQRWLNRVVLQLADRILCGCDALAESARARVSSARRTRVETLPLPVNTRRFQYERAASRDTARFINVGSLLPVKDQALLLHALSRVRSHIPHAQLTIAGSGVLASQLQALTHELGLERAVTFAGNVPHDQLPALYHAADVFVQGSRHEGQGMALLEAAACGCAVCGTDVGALRDLGRRDAALTAPVGDVNALAGVMSDALRRRDEYGSRAGQIVQQEYNLERVCERLECVYKVGDH